MTTKRGEVEALRARLVRSGLRALGSDVSASWGWPYHDVFKRWLVVAQALSFGGYHYETHQTSHLRRTGPAQLSRVTEDEVWVEGHGFTFVLVFHGWSVQWKDETKSEYPWTSGLWLACLIRLAAKDFYAKREEYTSIERLGGSAAFDQTIRVEWESLPAQALALAAKIRSEFNSGGVLDDTRAAFGPGLEDVL